MPTRYLATLEGVEHEFEVEELASNQLRLKLGDHQFDVDIRRLGTNGSFSIIVDHRSFSLDVVLDGEELVVSSREGATRVTLIDKARRGRRDNAARIQARGRAELKAMMPGRVVNVLVEVGSEVNYQQGLVVVEAMKMENELKSPKAGKVAEIKVKPGQTVEKGDLLVVIE
jgi:biotin carboxyl carrier protein